MAKGKNEVKNIAEKIMNNHKAQAVSYKKGQKEGTFEGEKTLYRPDGKKIKVLNFSGKKTKALRLLYKKNVEFRVEKGTLWEDIPYNLKNELNWEDSHFQN